MTKPLSNFTNKDDKAKIIKKRIASKSGGLGYLSAVDAMKYISTGSTKAEISNETDEGDEAPVDE